MSARLDLHDLQGNLVRGYGRFGFPKGRYVFLHIEEPGAGRRFLHQLLGVVTPAVPWSGPRAASERPRATTNVALSYAGLVALGLPSATLGGFPEDFATGMRARAALLGDDGPSAPEHWDPIWREPEPVHVFVSIYSGSVVDLEQRYDELLFMADAAGGVRVLGGHRGEDPAESGAYQDASALFEDGRPTPREHFGYVNGLSDPYFEGSESNAESLLGGGKRTAAPPDTPQGWAPLATGEFLLGYRDEAGEYPRAPEPRLLVRNGTFLVYRKLHQNVASFERYLEALGKQHGGKEWAAAKFAGRWRGGAPLSSFPTQEAADAFAAQLAAAPSGSEAYRTLRRQLLGFDFGADAAGARCPLGAHIRRSNPRSALEFGEQDAFDSPGALVNRRRMLRRGLPYGQAGSPPRDDGNHGLIFMALGTAIERQFEFVQQQWLNYGNDFRLSSERDPLLGSHAVAPDGSGLGKFIVQGDPEQGRPPLFCSGLPRFVETRGGDYFFVPSLTALRMLAAGSVDPT